MNAPERSAYPPNDAGFVTLFLLQSLMLDLIVLSMLLLLIRGAAQGQALQQRVQGMERNARMILYFQDQIEKSRQIHVLPAAYAPAGERVVYFDDLQARTLYTGQKNSYQFLAGTGRIRRRLYRFSTAADAESGQVRTEIETSSPVLIRFTEVENFSLLPDGEAGDGTPGRLRLTLQSGGEAVSLSLRCHKPILNHLEGTG